MIKPKIVLLLVFTGMAGMLVAYRETDKVPDALQLAVGFAAIFLGSAGAEVLTNYHDRDIDAVMQRTKKRPIPSGRISPRNALVFGLVASILSVVLAYWFNWIAAAFMLIGLVDNVGVYSLWLKRRSWLNIILGGISGGMPVLVGYSAIAATVSPLAIFMSALVIVWIPTHIWSLAIKVKEDYREAHVPMLPVIVSERVGTLCIAITSSLLAVFSLAIVFVVEREPVLHRERARRWGSDTRVQRQARRGQDREDRVDPLQDIEPVPHAYLRGAHHQLLAFLTIFVIGELECLVQRYSPIRRSIRASR